MEQQIMEAGAPTTRADIGYIQFGRDFQSVAEVQQALEQDYGYQRVLDNSAIDEHLMHGRANGFASIVLVFGGKDSAHAVSLHPVFETRNVAFFVPRREQTRQPGFYMIR
jgi:hypothetical protein